MVVLPCRCFVRVPLHSSSVWGGGVRCSGRVSGNLYIAEMLKKGGDTWLMLSANSQKKDKRHLRKASDTVRKARGSLGECDILNICI